MPKLGTGRSEPLHKLLDVVPLDRLHSCLEQHVHAMPALAKVSPLCLFGWQIVHLGEATMLCGLDAASAVTEISVSLLGLICCLFESGLGKKPEEKEGGDEDGKDGPTEWAGGTGMGEGDGLKDVTEEIEDDAQLEGTRNEEKEAQQKPPDVPNDEEDTAREVGFDLDTEAQAVPQDENAEGEKQEQEEEKKDLDREMGDVDLNAGGSLDEKMWNGEEDEEKDDKPEPNDQKEKETNGKEDIEAHGARGEGEAETVAGEEDAKQEGEQQEPKQGGSEEKKEEENEQSKPQEEEENATEQEVGQNKTPFDAEKDGQFDVTMQPEGPGEGQGDGDGEGGSDVQSDFIKDDEEDGDGDGEADADSAQGGEGANSGDEQLDGVADLDQATKDVPRHADEDDEDGENQQDNAGVDPCIEGDAKHEEEEEDAELKQDEQQNESSENARKLGPEQQEDEGQQNPACQGDPITTSSASDNAPQPNQEHGESLFGGTSGASTTFESKPQDSEDASDAKGADKGGSASSSTNANAATEVPSSKPEQQKAGSQRQAHPAQEALDGHDESAPERRLQKVDIIGGAEENNELAGGEQKQAGAEKGLHLSDPKSGVEALGESDAAQNQALGVVQQEGDDDAEAPTMAEEESVEEQDKKLSSMRLQQLDKEVRLEDVRMQPDGEAPEQPDAPSAEAMAGSSKLANNMAVTNLPMLRNSDVEFGADAASDDEPDLGRARRRQRSERELRQLWNQLEQSTAPLAAALCEQLRIILEPTLKGRLQGFYRTGKRISMRRVIPFIASGYRRDKIWLRRTKPSKREYQVLVAIDNSRSMSECGVGPMALQTLSVLCQALARLEVGEYAVLAFGSSAPRVLLPLGTGQPHTAMFGWEQARPLLSEFVFDEESADSHNRSFADMMQLGSAMFEEQSGSRTQRPFSQVMLIISDGRFNKAKVRAWVHASLARQQLPLLIIVDPAATAPVAGASSTGADMPHIPVAQQQRRSVFDLRAVTYEGGQCNVVPYLQDFPFPYYVVVQDLNALPGILSDVLKQWFEIATAT